MVNVRKRADSRATVDGVVRAVIDFGLRRKLLVLGIAVILLVWGFISLQRLRIDSYPDFGHAYVQVITQWPGHLPEDIEQQITIPIEAAVNGVAYLKTLRSTSLFGLSVIDLLFDDAADDVSARQNVFGRLAELDLPPNSHTRLAADHSPLGQIYFYTLTSTDPQHGVMGLKALQEQYLVRELKSVPNVVDVSTFGGVTREYEVQVDPNKLVSFGLTLSQVEHALESNNAGGSGTFLERGEQSYNIHTRGHFASADDIGAVVLKSQNGQSIRVRDVAIVTEAPKIRLGRVGKAIRRADGRILDEDDVIEGIVLLRKGADVESTAAALEQKVGELNAKGLPPGVRIVPYLNRGDLVQVTRRTVAGNLTLGLLLIAGTLFLFLRNVRSVFILAVTIPFVLSLAWMFLDLSHVETSWLSVAFIDFGMCVGGTVVMIENIILHMHPREGSSLSIGERVRIAAHQLRRPVFYGTLIIIAAHLPIFTMQQMEGKTFRPVAWTIVFVTLGGMASSLVLAPVLACFLFRREVKERQKPWLVSFMLIYRHLLQWFFRHSWVTAGAVFGCFAGTLYLLSTGAIGYEFLPHVDEGAIGIRETLPPSMGPTKSSLLMKQTRSLLASYPEVTEVVSHTGRPDDGAEPTGFFNIDYLVNLKSHNQWRTQFRTKEQLIAAMRSDLREHTFGAVWTFSQPMQGKMEEALTGMRGPLALKLFGNDLEILEQKGSEIVRVMAKIPGIEDPGLLRVGGQPNVNVVVDHEKTDHYGINLNDVLDATEAALGGKLVSQIIEADRRFDVVVRYEEPYRQTVQNIARVPLLASSGEQVALSELSELKIEEGASVIYREGGSRYVTIPYSIRGSDPASIRDDAKNVVARQINLPPGYRLEWTGTYDSQKQAQTRLALGASVTVFIMFLIAYWMFHSFRWAMLVLFPVGFAATGAVGALYWTSTHFSVYSSLAFLTLAGIAAQVGVLMAEYIRKNRAGDAYMRPIVLTSAVAAAGLLPTAFSHGIGSDSQRPFAIVIVGGLIVTSIATPLILPVLSLRLAKIGDKLTSGRLWFNRIMRGSSPPQLRRGKPRHSRGWGGADQEIQLSDQHHPGAAVLRLSRHPSSAEEGSRLK